MKNKPIDLTQFDGASRALVTVKRFKEVLKHYGATINQAANERDHADYLNCLDAERELASIPLLVEEVKTLRASLSTIVKQFDADPDGRIGVAVVNDARSLLP